MNWKNERCGLLRNSNITLCNDEMERLSTVEDERIAREEDDAWEYFEKLVAPDIFRNRE